MSIASQQQNLVRRLQRMKPLIEAGLTVEAGNTGDIVIVRNHHVYGVWFVSDEGLQYVPGGYNERMTKLFGVDEAVAWTQHLLQKRRPCPR